MGRTLVLWRHGRTDWNDQNRFQGSTDIPLNEVGVAQAERAARLLAALAPTAIVSSDLSRALDTAAPLARLTGLAITTDADLRETNGGGWEGRIGADIRVNDGATFAAWLDSENVIAGATGERRSEVAARAHRAIVKAFEPVAHLAASLPTWSGLTAAPGVQSAAWPTAPGRSLKRYIDTTDSCAGGWSNTTRARSRNQLPTR
jgi:broad specificity phosphatase PhoE